MTIDIAPIAALSPTTPSVGIFWQLGNVLIIDRSSLIEAEPYGDCLTHSAGHYERWQSWQSLGSSRLRSLGYPEQIVSSEYDEWPRGRIVHEVPSNRFVLYADRRIQQPETIAALTKAFHLQGHSVVVMSDTHYR